MKSSMDEAQLCLRVVRGCNFIDGNQETPLCERDVKRCQWGEGVGPETFRSMPGTDAARRLRGWR